MSDAFSATIITGAFVLPDGISGNTEASTTLSCLTPLTLKQLETVVITPRNKTVGTTLCWDAISVTPVPVHDHDSAEVIPLVTRYVPKRRDIFKNTIEFSGTIPHLAGTQRLRMKRCHIYTETICVRQIPEG